LRANDIQLSEAPFSQKHLGKDRKWRHSKNRSRTTQKKAHKKNQTPYSLGPWKIKKATNKSNQYNRSADIIIKCYLQKTYSLPEKQNAAAKHIRASKYIYKNASLSKIATPKTSKLILLSADTGSSDQIASTGSSGNEKGTVLHDLPPYLAKIRSNSSAPSHSLQK